MPTIKNRINITTSKDMEKALRYVAKRDGLTVAGKAAELIRGALEIEEDLEWVRVIKERTSKKVKLFTHKQVWG